MDISQYSGRHRTYFHPPFFLQTDIAALQTQKTAPSDSFVQRFLWKNRKSRIFEALF